MIINFRGEYNWLSNMYNCDIEHEGVIFKSVENAYMYCKNPTKEWKEFCLNNPPNIVKKESKNQPLIEDWENVKLHIMFNFLKQKFKKEPLRSKLLETENQNIIEGNYWNDKFWGMCLKSTPMEGENHLGRLIMYIRIMLKNNKL